MALLLLLSNFELTNAVKKKMCVGGGGCWISKILIIIIYPWNNFVFYYFYYCGNDVLSLFSWFINNNLWSVISCISQDNMLLKVQWDFWYSGSYLQRVKICTVTKLFNICLNYLDAKNSTSVVAELIVSRTDCKFVHFNMFTVEIFFYG